MNNNYYKILEVDSGASPEVIEKAYKALAKKYHPDLQEEGQKEAAGEKLKLINEAYDVLSDPTSRAEYDKKLTEENTFNNTNRSNENTNMNMNNNSNNMYQNGNSNYNNKKNNMYQNSNYNNNIYNQQNDAYDRAAREFAQAEEQMRKEQELEERQHEIEYQEELQKAKQKAYYDAYIQDLKNRGYKIKYKKSPKENLKTFLAILITAGIVAIVIQIPIVKKFIVELYNGNPLIKSICDAFKK